MRYVLRPREGTCTFQKITRGRKWIGRVTQHADGDYVGVIGEDMVRAPNPVMAFEMVVAKRQGFRTVGELKEMNRQISQRNRAAKQRARYTVDQMLKGNFKPLDELFGLTKPGS